MIENDRYALAEKTSPMNNIYKIKETDFQAESAQ